jgi:hypothetical protein
MTAHTERGSVVIKQIRVDRNHVHVGGYDELGVTLGESGHTHTEGYILNMAGGVNKTNLCMSH